MAECTIYDKLRYIAETKDLIKAAIEAQDVEVLESATFRQYAEYITEIRKVSSVNGMQGDVTITASDLGALTEIPSEYITETELNEKGYLTAVPDTYATEQWVNEQGFLKEHQDISNLATKSELDAKQDTISDLETIRSGAAKGATALQSVPSEYITETELNEKGYLTAVPDVYITEDELSSQLADKVSQNGLNEAIEGVRNDIPTNVSELTNDSGYITLNEVPKVDLSGYALKSEIPDISVKQDKLTAGNGISITDNVISLDYEYDLFEVVQSLPTENISDNKVYLVLDSNGSEGNTYVEYLYVNGQWEELGKFKVNIDLSGYATEQWVNEQGFLKEHQDISNLATKAELATKQDTISDLETIRSGASKGSTALQSVPSTYAKKTDILTAKTDTRYTTFDVQNPVLSGKTILLQNEVTDSRKYHTFGYEKTITASVPVSKYINITRNYNGTPSMDTNIESGIDFSVDSDGVGHMYIQITFTLDKIKNATNLMHYEVTYPERDSEGNVTGCGEQVVADVTYDPNTKLLSIPEGGFGFAQIQRSDTNHYLFGGGTDGNEYLENGRWYYNFEQGPLQEGATLTWYVSCNTPYQYCDYSVTINNLFYEEGSVTTDDKPERLNDYIRYANNVKAYILTDKNTTFKTINGQQITGDGDITIDTNVDLSNYATKSELNTKQDTISDLDTIRIGAEKGATALQSVPSGYATEQWVNEQGFLKEHQDISNLATKAELATKQDVINDLDTIRSGAAKGATALQSVPDTYALKSDILSAKTDTRYTTFDVQNPVLSGNTIVLQNEVTDSRKYHTLGYDKTAETTEIGQVIKYSIFNGEFDENGSPIIDTNFDNHQTMPLDFSHITDDGDQIIIHYTGSFANVDYENGTRTEGDSFEATITYNRNTKQLNASDDSNVTIYHFTRSDTGEYIFNPNNKEFSCYMLPDDAYLIWDIGNMSTNLYYRYNVSTQGKLFVGETQTTTPTSRLPQNKNEFFRYENDVKAYILTDKNTTFKTINGQQITGNGNIELATKDELNEKQNIIPDLYSIRIGAEKGATALQSVPSGYATEQWVNEQGFLKEHQDISNLATKEELNAKQDTINDLETIRSGAAKGATALQTVPDTYALKTDIPDITTKQDTLVSGTNIKTINGTSLLGSGDITIDTNVDLSDYATKSELATKQDVISDLDSIRSGASKGATALQSVPSGYATEQWVNEQGFLKEHQDISNLATKAELNAKQDVINDLEAIRSGAEKGATALQTVPDTYALKSEIKTVNGTSLIGNGNIELATKDELNAKQDVISDLETIRSGAAKGATALQSVPDTYALKSEIPDISTKQDNLVSGTNIKTINGTSLLGSGNIEVAANVDLSSYATKEELNAKQDTLVSGTNIKTINGTSLLGSGDITIEGGSGNVDLSNYYTKTETNALVNPKLEQVTLTQAEYDALQTKEENVLYIISDAEDLKFKTINGQQITGEGNIEIKASADNVPTLQTTPKGTTSNYIYSTGIFDGYGVISDISNAITYSTDKASIKTWKQYWGEESSMAYQSWSINGATTSQAGLMSSSDKSKLDGIDTSIYSTKTELATKQDTLVSGTNIKTVNGTSLLGSGNIEIVKEWIGTQSEYDALQTKDNNTTYYITE